MSSTPRHLQEHPQLKFFGRRLGKKLTARQQAIWQETLPSYQISPATVKDNNFWRHHESWWLEIGFGGGENLYHWAQTRPEVGFIGAEPFRHSAVKLLSKIIDDAATLPNLHLYTDDIHHLLPHMPDGCLEKIIILYPDPWKKRRHTLRRMISPLTLPIFCRLLKPAGQILIATDHAIFLQSTMMYFQQDKNFIWSNHQPLMWLQRPDILLPSRYELKSQAQHDKQKKFGKYPTYLLYTKKNNELALP